MRAITLWQPWASLIAYGYKQYETRSWSTTYRGPLAIHAAKRKPSDIGFEIPWKVQLPLGVVVATCTLADCVSTTKLLNLSDQEYCYGDYGPGRFAWRLDNIVKIDPVPARGSQGFWEWSP